MVLVGGIWERKLGWYRFGHKELMAAKVVPYVQLCLIGLADPPAAQLLNE